MKIGILTLPLHTNYGGVLQAYALQYSLRCMGHEAYLIDCRFDPKYANYIKYPIAGMLKIVSNMLPPLRGRLAPLERQMRADKVVIRQHTEAFIRRHIPLRHYFCYNLISKRDFEAIVVGSDQVWRPDYFPRIEMAYLDFASGWNIRRIAYAASFGVDRWEYNQNQTEKCRELVSLFDALSLRERSGVELCHSELLCEACEVLDPTLLLSKQEYMSLVAEQTTVQKKEGGMLVSLLDNDLDKLSLVEAISQRYSTTPFFVNSRVEDRTAPLEERVQPPVEEWLQGFDDADYVVTDSYHASIFAIIFNKPFVVYGNKDRGYARFISLLSKLGLESQFVLSSSQINLAGCFQIDWQSVNNRLQELRKESLDFLESAINPLN
ncbi:MAG: polysaccharide pyruvyl transferase family protein [Rikenellaceae bacterium]